MLSATYTERRDIHSPWPAPVSVQVHVYVSNDIQLILEVKEEQQPQHPPQSSPEGHAAQAKTADIIKAALERSRGYAARPASSAATGLQTALLTGQTAHPQKVLQRITLVKRNKNHDTGDECDTIAAINNDQRRIAFSLLAEKSDETPSFVLEFPVQSGRNYEHLVRLVTCNLNDVTSVNLRPATEDAADTTTPVPNKDATGGEHIGTAYVSSLTEALSFSAEQQRTIDAAWMHTSGAPVPRAADLTSIEAQMLAQYVSDLQRKPKFQQYCIAVENLLTNLPETH